MGIHRIIGVIALVAGVISISAAAMAYEKSAGPIWNDWDARNKCPSVCAPDAWDGNWRTVVPGFDSVCSCQPPRSHVYPLPGPWPRRISPVGAGPIWNNMDAQNKCPQVCGGREFWDGNWRTVGPGQSTCDCYVR